MNVIVGFALGLVASSPTSDSVVMLSVGALFAVDSGITGFLFEKAR